MRAILAVILTSVSYLAIGFDAVQTQPAAPAIEWRLENTFRLFKRAGDTEALRAEFRKLADRKGSAPTVLEFEQHLAVESEGWGWSERLVGNVVQEACWYRRDQECSDYARPTSHRVTVKLTGHEGSCNWHIDGKPMGATANDCAKPTVLDIPFPTGAEIAAVIDGTQVATTRIQVRDLLIVSLGDSFASGEGNPDRAVRFQPGRVVRYGTSDPKLRGYPARAGEWRNTSDQVFADGGALWLHRPCHRSLYSAHARTALHMALSDEMQHTAVTFISTACTGAAVEDGLFMPSQGNDSGGSEERVTVSQLSGIAKAICAPDTTKLGTENYVLRAIEGAPQRERTHRIFSCPKEQAREIDLLLLSIGGNDIGFNKLVAWTSLSDIAEPALKGTLTRDPAQARPYLGSLRHNYGEVGKAIRDALHVDAKRVVLTAYPKMGFDEKSAPCRSGPDGMQVSPVFRFYGRRAETVERFADTELTPLMREAATEQGWLWAEAHRDAAMNHGFCAKSGSSGTVADAGERGFPFRRTGRAEAPDTGLRYVAASSTGSPAPRAVPKATPREGGARAAGWLETAPRTAKWTPYPPSEFRPYLPRARWFRSPNDAFLTVNLHFGTVGDRANLTQFVASSGAFHPNAQGHAATADAILDTLTKTGTLNPR